MALCVPLCRTVCDPEGKTLRVIDHLPCSTYLFQTMLRPLGFTNPQGLYCHHLTFITFPCLWSFALSHPLSRCKNTSRK